MPKYFQAPWKVRDLLLSLLITIIFALATYRFVSIDNIFISFFAQWVILLIPILLISLKYNLKISHFGFHKVKIPKLIKSLASHYLFYIIVNLVLLAIISLFIDSQQIPGYQEQPEIISHFQSNLVLGIFIIAVLGPLLEEIFFRGIILQTITNKLGSKWGTIITALIFTAVHFPWQSFIPIFILALILNRLFLIHKSIWPSLAFHILQNTLAVIGLLTVST